MKKKQLTQKQALIAQMVEMYDIKDTKDIQEALKDLLGGTIQSMLESEMDEHLGYAQYERSNAVIMKITGMEKRLKLFAHTAVR